MERMKYVRKQVVHDEWNEDLALRRKHGGLITGKRGGIESWI